MKAMRFKKKSFKKLIKEIMKDIYKVALCSILYSGDIIRYKNKDI